MVGWLFRQIHAERNALHQPLIQSGKLNIDGLISSIRQVINPDSTTSLGGKYGRFEEVTSVLNSSYYDTSKLNTGKMLQGAVKAFVDAIDDPYTMYLDSAENSGFQEEIKWETNFEWIGAVISKKDYYVQIDEVIKWSPAFVAGLQMLDRIVMVNTWSIKDLNINQAMALIRWPKGTSVVLTIERVAKDGKKSVFVKNVIRDALSIPSVTSIIFTGQKTLWYINISIIGEETENLLKKTLGEFKNQKIDGIILDLRWNVWGFLDVAAKIVSHFVPKGKLVVTAKYKSFGDESFSSEGYGDIKVPVIVLVDGLTASAGEIIAMALQEQIWAKLVGTQTFGKGSIQTLEEFSDGASLKYTIGKWYSPSGKNIDKVWITPDVVVEFDVGLYTGKKLDNQLESAKKMFK